MGVDLLRSFQDELTERQRDVFRRVWGESESQQHIAEALDINHRRVKQIVSAVKRRAAKQSIPLPPLPRGRRHRVLAASAAGLKGMDLDSI